MAAQQQADPTPGAFADIKDASGKTVATAELRDDQGKVQVALTFPTPAPFNGKHALHITEVGRCDPPDFATAGAIFNPLGKKHGLLSTGGPMVGDLPNVNMPLLRYNAPALGATLGTGPATLLGPRGTALVIYANEDDGVSDPEGNAGARIACGVITAASQSRAPGPIQPASSQTSNAAPTPGPALIILVLGAGLIAAGLLLRRPRTPRP